MEKKNIAITLQEAKEWYTGKNPTLKELALKAFNKEELEEPVLPKTWEEFCKMKPIKEEYFIDNTCNLVCITGYRNSILDKNSCTSKQEAEAFLALMQLRQLRKAYVKNWEPDWKNDNEPKYCINLQANPFNVQCWYHMSNPFSFPTYELAKQFLDNFKDLLKIAKPLL